MSDNTLIVRSCFENDITYEKVCNLLRVPEEEFGFLAHLEYINDEKFKQKSAVEILELLILNKKALEEEDIFFVIDEVTIFNTEHTVLCVEVQNEKDINVKLFRVIPSSIWSVENNLRLANMDYSEFLNASDDGVFREF